MEPEGWSPCADSCVVEYVGACLANVALDADNSLSIFDTSVTRIRTISRALRADTVELEESEIVLLNHVVAAVDKVVVVVLIA